MHFVNDIADGDSVYQSLHQAYLKAIKMLYPRLTRNNIRASHSYYFNIRTLYLEWVEKNNNACVLEQQSFQNAYVKKDKMF